MIVCWLVHKTLTAEIETKTFNLKTETEILICVQDEIAVSTKTTSLTLEDNTYFINIIQITYYIRPLLA